MKAKKLPSGNWRVQVFIGKDGSGKNVMRSVTAPSKRQVELAAAELLKLKDAEVNLKLEECASRYLELKKPVVSYGTYRGYKTIYERYIKGSKLGSKSVSRIKSSDAQKWVSDLTMQVSPKTVRNAFSMVSSTMTMFCPDTTLHVKFPQAADPELHTPSSDEIKQVLRVFEEEGDFDMIRAIYLSSCCSLRRGEVAALLGSDVDRDRRMIRITKSMSGDGSIKPPKTRKSIRIVPAPAQLIELLPPSGRLVDLKPEQISNRFLRATKKAGCTHFRYHDLRHYWATIMTYEQKMPVKIIQEIGGWSSDQMMRRVYVGVIEEEKKRQLEAVSDTAAKHFFD